MINFKDIEKRMMPVNLKLAVESVKIIPSDYKMDFDEITKEELENLLILKMLTKKNSRKIIQNLSLVDTALVELFSNFCLALFSQQLFKPANLKRLFLRSIQGIDIKMLPSIWQVLSGPLNKLTVEKDEVLEFYDRFIRKEKFSYLFSTVIDIASFDEILRSFYVQKESIFYDVAYYTFLIDTYQSRPGLLDSFNVWGIVKNSIYSSSSIPLLDKLILAEPFPSKDMKKLFFDKISIDQLKLPDVFKGLSNESKIRLQSWRNTQNLLHAFSRANGMEDRKEFWPMYSETVLNVYFSPHPNNIVLMEFPEHYVIEFVEISNACFFYPKNFDSIKTMLGLGKLKSAISMLISICNQFPGYDINSLQERSSFMQKNRITADNFKSGQNLKLSHNSNWQSSFAAKLYNIGVYTQDVK